MQVLLFNLAALAGSCAQGLTGFGSGTLTATLLVMLFPFHEVIPVVAMLVLVPNIMLAWLTRHEMEWRRGPVAAVGIALGIIIGAQLLAILPVDLLRRALGVVILVYVALMLIRTPAPAEAPAASRGDSLSLGLCSLGAGVIVGAVGVSPIPLLIYVSLRYPKKLARVVLTQAFLVGTVAQVSVYAYLGLLSPSLAWTALLTVPGIVLGTLIGHRLHYRVNQKTFARALALILLVPAVRLVMG
ncbi:sulfite exporter TauE/SafE family protein [Salinisphaera aquimarina]|uniref:Probable membrane transporter protein n=1 Tax=Salinisphaera aquimarina TaxID=2094031 RepID=A0ABV7EJY9_9GAMM